MFDHKDDPQQVNSRDEEVAELLDRVQRLEDAVAALQDTEPLEERVYQRLQKTPPQTKTSTPPAKEQITNTQVTSQPPADDSPPFSTWLLLEYVADIGMIGRMFVDMSYHVTWSTRMTVLILMPIILVSGWFFTLIGGILDKIIMVFVLFYVYKTLMRELHRYRKHLARRVFLTDDSYSPSPT